MNDSHVVQGSSELAAYLDSIQRITDGETVTMPEFLHHFDVQNSGVRSGPPVGARFPAFELADPGRIMQGLGSLAGEAGLLLVFVRSVNWCGYCRNQLAELNLSLPRIRQAGFEVAAVSPEDPDLIARFTAFAHLDYPILSDPGAAFIEQLGILNATVPASSHKQNGGRIPFPGHFLLAPDGMVLDKHFTDDLRHRSSGANLVLRRQPDSFIPVATHQSELVAFDLYFATDAVQTGQTLGLLLRLRIAPGAHVYSHDAAPPYAALQVRIESAEFACELHFTWPPSHETRFEASGETALTYEGEVDIHGTLRLPWSPPVHGSRHIEGLQQQLQALQTRPGSYRLCGEVRWQACSGSLCLPAETLSFETLLRVEPDIDKVQAYFASEIRSGK